MYPFGTRGHCDAPAAALPIPSSPAPTVGEVDTYEVVVVVAVKNAVREIVSPTTYDTPDQANAELAKITVAQRSGDEWPDVAWLSVRGADVSAAFVRAGERRGGLSTDLESLMRRMQGVLGRKPTNAGDEAGRADDI
jgi:hypothetical protein